MNLAAQIDNKTRIRRAFFSLAIFCLAISSHDSLAGDREQAMRIHDRLAGVPPTNAVLDLMEARVAANDLEGAADIAMQNPAFYNVTLKNFAAPWTNEEQSVFVPLNDYTATVIGMIRDNIAFNEVLSADLVYVGANGLGLPAYSMSNNDHYEAMERRGIDLSNTSNLVAESQSGVTNNAIPASAAAGVVTTRAAARAFFVEGTNRAMFRFTMMNHLCNDLEQVKDVSRTPDRIRQDVSRSPGGDSRIYMTSCVGCHAGMDPLAQAYAYYEWEFTGNEETDKDRGRLVYTPNNVQGKYLINANNFKYGYITTDDSWDNYWRQGPNADLLGFGPGSGSGRGAASLGRELANSQAFANCQVKKVFRTVCFREPDNFELTTIADDFKNNGYLMKRVFAKAAASCEGP